MQESPTYKQLSQRSASAQPNRLQGVGKEVRNFLRSDKTQIRLDPGLISLFNFNERTCDVHKHVTTTGWLCFWRNELTKDA